MAGWFSGKPGVRGLLGQGNWLFLCGDSNDAVSQLTGRQPISDKYLSQYREVFLARAAKFKEMGVSYFFFVAPTKEVVYEDRLPHGFHIDYDNFPATQVLHAVSGTNVLSIYLRDALVAARSVYGDVYHRTDTHWNPRGAYAAYAEIHRNLSQVLPLTPIVEWEALTFRNEDRYRGDLSDKPKAAWFPGEPPRLLDLADGALTDEECEETAMRLAGNMPHQRIPAEDYLKVSETRDVFVFEMPDKKLPKAVVFRDSFAIAVIPYLSRHFSRIAYIWKAEPDFDIIEAEKPDVVINLNLDRFLRIPPNR